MKKIGVTVGLAIAALIGGAVAIAFYFWNQATKLPEWYTNQEATNQAALSDVGEIRSVSEIVDAKLQAGNADVRQINAGGYEVTFNQEEFNQLVVSAIADNPSSRPILENAKGFNTTIEDSRLESGMIINMSEVPVERLGAGEREILQRAITTFPALANQEVYVGIEGRPRMEDGQLKFDDVTEVKLGNLSLTLAELSRQLGISQEQIEERINLQLQLGRLNADEIEFAGDRALVRGSLD